MPFGALLALAGIAVLPAFGSGDAKIAHLAAILEALHFRVSAQIAYQNDLVDRTRHISSDTLEVLIVGWPADATLNRGLLLSSK